MAGIRALQDIFRCVLAILTLTCDRFPLLGSGILQTKLEEASSM